MDETKRFRINSPQVVHQAIEGEVVIINLESGFYYSLDATGAEVWSMLEAGGAPDEITTALQSRYDAPAGAIEAGVAQFVEQLQAESLIVPAHDGLAPRALGTALDPPRGRATFAAPTLAKYTDMQDLLLLDPIHEVDDSGWPGTKAGRETSDD